MWTVSRMTQKKTKRVYRKAFLFNIFETFQRHRVAEPAFRHSIFDGSYYCHRLAPAKRCTFLLNFCHFTSVSIRKHGFQLSQIDKIMIDDDSISGVYFSWILGIIHIEMLGTFSIQLDFPVESYYYVANCSTYIEIDWNLCRNRLTGCHTNRFVCIIIIGNIFNIFRLK